MEARIRGNVGRDMAEKLIHSYFRTFDYPFTRHHIESFDQFLGQDVPAIIRSENPFVLLQKPIGSTGLYGLKAEIFVGGFDASRIYIGTPSLNLRDTEEIRLMYPNEARLRNLHYASQIEADIVVRITFTNPNPSGGSPLVEEVVLDPAKNEEFAYLARFPLVKMPIMLHSRYCILHGKPQAFLREAGECQYDQGGYFIVDGSEKVLVSSQEAAFNTLTISLTKNDPDNELKANIRCLNPATRQVKQVSFLWPRSQNKIRVSIPFVRLDLPVFILFRAFGLQTDEDIVRAILPDPDSPETKALMPLLHESILDAFPFLDTFSSVQYIKTLTKGFSEAHVLNILFNQTFIHVENRPGARIAFLADCVRQILRVYAQIDLPTDKDDIRNQRVLTSGVLTRMLFQDSYKKWKKAMILSLDQEYKYNSGSYSEGKSFLDLFQQGSLNQLFQLGVMTDNLLKGFKGKWAVGGGKEKAGVIQPLSRLSYMDFMSHCRRVVLDFDTSLDIAGPHRLHTSQFGYFCTSETPGGKAIGITKNLSIMTAISTVTEPAKFIEWLFKRGGVISCDQTTAGSLAVTVPVYVNGGIVGYTVRPQVLKNVLKLMKWTGCLPAFASVGFSIRDRRVFVYLDEGRPMRPLIHLGPNGAIPVEKIQQGVEWRRLVMGNYSPTKERATYQTGFIDPLASSKSVTLEDYIDELKSHAGAIEYVDPYEANEAYVAMYPDYIKPETSHLEIHPSTIVGLLTSVIPYPNHNQSPRNQLSCSQSKQGLSVYATNYPNRFDNMVHVLSYAEAPIVRTLYYDYIADGQMGYGQNLIVAIGSFTGYNQDDGIIFNADSFQRGMFRNMTFRSYETFEEDDKMTKTMTRVANPARIAGWTKLKPGVDYSKLDERGIIRVGERVDESTVLVGMYLQSPSGDMRDASLTAQVWTTGRVEKVAVMINNMGRALVKIRVIQDRIPELGDKFSTRHGQKGTIGMLIRSHDMPRTADGLVPDMIVNPHCMPSRMTMAQMLESNLGKAAAVLGAIGNATAFMNEGNPAKDIGAVLRDQLGMNPMGDDILYDGMSGTQIRSSIFMGNIYIMRLKHMPEDKWNARAEGRKEQRTHAPTGGRGNQGGLRIGEMERDAIVGHGIADFVRESYMKRADGYTTVLCNGCGTIPVYNVGKRLYICPLCDGPVRFIGDAAANLEIIPPNKRSLATFSNVEIPYSLKVLEQELGFFMNMSMRMLTSHDVTHLRGAPLVELTADQQKAALEARLPERVVLDTFVPEMIEAKNDYELTPEEVAALGLSHKEAEEAAAPPPQVNSKVLNAAVEAAVNASLKTGNTAGRKVSSEVVSAAVNAAIAASKESEIRTAQSEVVVPANTTEVQTLSFSAPGPSIPLPRPTEMGPVISEPSGLSEGDYESLSQENDSGNSANSANSISGSRERESSQESYNGRGGGQGYQQGQGSVNVQTSSQPVLVVPLNMTSQQGGQGQAQYLNSAAPGAPATFAVDTSTITNPSAPRSQSNSRSASPSRNNAQKVSVTKTGGGGPPSPTPANTRVTVVKHS